MENNLENALTQIIERAVQGIDKSTEFLSDQLPDVIQQALVWHATKSAIECVFGVAGIILMFYGIYRFEKWNRVSWPKANGRSQSWVYCSDMESIYIVSIFLLIPFVISASFINVTWLQIWIAPKLWLVEYASSLVK